MLLATLFLAASLAAGDPCAVPNSHDARICSERVGHCFDLEINGQRVEFLQDAALRTKLTDALESKAVCWTLPKPISGDLDIVPRTNEYTAELGELRKGYEIVVTGLEGQQIPTHKGIRSDPTVKIGGLAMQTAVDVIDTKALPTGAYIVRVRIVGHQGYEDKSVYLHVAPASHGKDP
jgi:hypothetical protein